MPCGGKNCILLRAPRYQPLLPLAPHLSVVFVRDGQNIAFSTKDEELESSRERERERERQRQRQRDRDRETETERDREREKERKREREVKATWFRLGRRLLLMSFSIQHQTSTNYITANTSTLPLGLLRKERLTKDSYTHIYLSKYTIVYIVLC